MARTRDQGPPHRYRHYDLVGLCLKACCLLLLQTDPPQCQRQLFLETSTGLVKWHPSPWPVLNTVSWYVRTLFSNLVLGNLQTIFLLPTPSCLAWNSEGEKSWTICGFHEDRIGKCWVRKFTYGSKTLCKQMNLF